MTQCLHCFGYKRWWLSPHRDPDTEGLWVSTNWAQNPEREQQRSMRQSDPTCWEIHSYPCPCPTKFPTGITCAVGQESKEEQSPNHFEETPTLCVEGLTATLYPQVLYTTLLIHRMGGFHENLSLSGRHASPFFKSDLGDKREIISGNRFLPNN